MNIYLCPSPELYHLYHIEGSTTIITDIFRASTSITTAIENGAEAILPVASIDECKRKGAELGALMAAERNVKRCEFADFGNDPLEYDSVRVQGQRIVMTTTNGTRSLSIARKMQPRRILVGSFRNLPATVNYLSADNTQNVIVLAAGWQGQVCIEDCLYAGALVDIAEQNSIGYGCGDMSLIFSKVWRSVSVSQSTLLDFIGESEHYHRLLNAGHDNAIPYCLEISQAPAVLLDSDGCLRGANF